MKMTRRVLALLLALCLTFGNVMPAMATGLEGEETVVTEETIPVVPEVEETEAPAEAEETEAPEADVTEAPAEAEETEAPIVETEEEIVDEAANEAAPIAEMTPAEIVDAAYALAEGTSLEGTYTLTGMVTSIDTAYNSQYVTVTIVVEGRESKPIVCYRMKGTGADLIAENDTITVTGTLKNYYGTIEFDTGCSLDSYVKGETPDDAETPAATITFDAANRVSWDTSSQLWECNGITLTNSKGSSTSNVADYVAPARFYKSSSVKIEYPGMTKIVFECSGSKYTLKDADVADLGTVTTVGNTITLELFAPADVIEFTCASNQVRCNEIVIYASGEAVDPEDPTEPEPTEPEPTEPESGIDTAEELQQALYAGGEVVLGGDITADVYVEGGDITLDLRGHVLTVSNFCHTVGGKMTIKDSKGTGKIVGQVQNNLGDLTLEGVTVEGCVAAFGGNVIIDGCTIDNKNDIMGGIGVTVTAANFIDIGATNPKVIIKNSTVKGAPFTLDSGEVIYMWCLHTQDGGILEIQSGNFIGKVQIDSATDVTITGGTFTADISSLLGKGYTQNENGEVVKGDPAADSVLTITEALDLGASKAHDVYTEVKYYVTGEITEVYNTKYGNMKIKDEAGNILTVYGTYSADGSIRYDALDVKPVAGDMVTVYGIIGQYNGTPQLKNGWITEHVPAPLNFAFDNSGTGWDKVDAYVAPESGDGYRIDLVKTEGNVYYFSPDEYFPLAVDEIKSIGFCEYAGGGYTDIIAYENGKTYSAADFTITDESITVYWDNSVAQYEEMDVEYCCQHGGYEGPMVGHFGGWSFAKSIEGDIYTFELPACVADCAIWIGGRIGEEYQEDEYIAVDGMTYPQCIGRPGAESNPMMVTFEMNEDYTEGTATVTIPANKTYYFQAYGVGGMELFVNGASYMMLPTVMGRQPVTFTVENTTGADAEFVLTVTYPAGSQMNPETLYLGSQYTSLAEGNNQGHFYTYTADSDAVLEFSFAEDVAEGAADIAVTNMNTYAQRSIMWDAVDGVATIEVSAGDELMITVAALPDANNNYPAMDLQWNINYPAGSEQNPEMVQFSMNDDYTEGYATVTIPANTTYYFQAYGIGGMELYVNEEFYMVLPSVMGRQPVAFVLTNETEEAVSYDLRIAYPAGHQMNPAELMVYTEGESWDISEGKNVAQLSEGNWNGYLFRWFAPKSGELTIDVSNGRAGWSYSITNLNTYAQTDLHSSYDVPNVNAETITVSAGDEILISVNTCGASYSDVTPAGEVYFTATFVPVVGTEENPIQIEWNWNETWSEATATVTVPANTSIFASFTNGGMMLTINDGEPVEITGNGWMPQVLEFKGAEEGETVYNLKMFSPVGSFDNPAELVIGENSCEIAENSNGYIYKWTADSDGELTITMGADVESWSYCVNNLTTSMYGDTYSSTDEEIVSSYTVAVAAGDEIQITINTPFSYDTWSSPAGTVTFTADFAIPEGAEGNPIFVQFEMDESYMYGNAFVTVPAYTTYYFQSYGIGGMTLEIATEQAENEGWWIVDSFTLPNVMGRQPVVFSVTNDTAEDKEYGLNVSWAMGSQMNPENVTWWYGSTSVELAEGDTDGYYYTHTAPVTGPVEFFLNEAINFDSGEEVAVDIIITNMNTYEQKALSYDGVNGVVTMDVTEGDELQIIVGVQPDENWEYPAAYIRWGYGYIEGTEGNPTWMELGKTNVKIEAGDEDGFYLMGMVEETGYLTITMNSSNWEYKIGTYEDVYDEEGWWIGSEIVWSDLQVYNAKGAKSQTVYVNGGNYYLYVNTANKKAGTVTFTTTFASKLVEVAAGKSATLTFTDPATGKAIAASKADWEIYYIEANGEEVFYENFGDYATLANGKLTAAADIDSEVFVYAVATLKTDETVQNHYQIYIRPAATSIQINKGHVEEIYTDNGYMENWVTEEENVTELTYVVNADGYNDVKLNALVGPDAALQDVTWKSSNTKILDVGTYNTWTENGKMQVVYLNSVFNPKTGKVGTGTVTLTATANDGSGVKATVNVNVVLETKEIHIYPKNDQWQIVPGKSATMMAEVYTWYNQAPTNDDITWEIADIYVFDFENYEWIPYEGDAASVATINNKGVVKAANVDKVYEVTIRATAQDNGTVAENTIYVALPAKTGEIMEVPASYDVNSGEAVQPRAMFYDKNGNEALAGYTWSVSDKKVAEFIWVIDSEDEYGNTYGHYELQFTGKTGKVTLTATANDGSRAKATWTINVTKAPNVIEMIEEASVAAGATLTLKATPAFESYDRETDTPIYDYAVSDKTILWDAKVVERNEDMWEWVEVEQDIGLKISNGKLSTNARKITGTEPITVKVTATAKLGVYDSTFDETNCASATCIVTVYPATKQVDLVKSGEIVSKKTLTVEESDYIVLDAVGAPVGEYIWTSSNEKVAIVENNADGSVTIRSAGKMGKATITATANDGTKKSAKVTVNFVKAVEEIYFPEDLFLSVAKGKSVNFSKIAVVGPTDASNKKLTWSMEWVAFDEATGEYVTKGDGKVPTTVATMSNGTVKAVMKNVKEFEYVRITATAADKFGASCEAIVVLAPNAIKGVELYIVDEAGEIDSTNYAKKSYATTDSQVVLRAVATNGPDDLVASGLTLTSSDKNFEVVWGEMGIVVKAVEGAENPYGKVKVTLKATDGSNVNTNITIEFKQPEA